MRRLLDRLRHLGYEWVPADEINAESGTMDDYCTRHRRCREANAL